MNKILNSASRLVFLILTVALVVLTFTKIVSADQFITLAGMAFGYYFGSRNQNIELVDNGELLEDE